MLGFLAAIVNEFGTGQSVYSQLLSGGGGAATVVIGLVLLASFAPAVVRQVRGATGLRCAVLSFRWTCA